MVRASAAIAAGALALAAAAISITVAPGAAGYLGAALALVMMAIAVIDGSRFIIPDELTAAALVLALVNAAVQAPDGALQAVAVALLRGTVLMLVFWGLRAAYRRLRGRDGLGLGDVKLAGVAGAWLDWVTMPIAVQIAAVTAIAVYAFAHVVAGKPLTATSRLPFGLYLAPSIWLAWLLEASLRFGF